MRGRCWPRVLWRLPADCDVFLPYLGSFLLEAAAIPTEVGAFARYAHDKLKLLAYRVRQKERTGSTPPRPCSSSRPTRSEGRCASGSRCRAAATRAVQIDPVSTAADVFTPLTTKAVRLNDPSEFAIYEVSTLRATSIPLKTGSKCSSFTPTSSVSACRSARATSRGLLRRPR